MTTLPKETTISNAKGRGREETERAWHAVYFYQASFLAHNMIVYAGALVRCLHDETRRSSFLEHG